MNNPWNGLRDEAAKRLTQRNYRQLSLAQRLGSTGVEVEELLATDRAELVSNWIPGVELFPRRIFPQRHRGFFGEFARQEEGPLAKVNVWPKQWATATLWAGSAKGFHIHPPHIPGGVQPGEWFRRLYVEEPGNVALRPYDLEQWDAMFFVQGTVEMILVDERVGMPRRIMRFIVDGDNHRGGNNAGVLIPAGVAHAMRAESSENVIMVYGTTTKFDPAAEGRIESGLETSQLPPEWDGYLFGGAE
ncbi:MAG: hypothetical protein WCP06_05805 [Verrucomicrobiota bacterium]